MLYHVISYHPTLCLYIYIYVFWVTIVVSPGVSPKCSLSRQTTWFLNLGVSELVYGTQMYLSMCIYIYIHIQCLLLSLVDWCMIYWWVYKHLIFTLNPSSNTCKTYITISLSQPVVVCRKWSCMLPMPKNWVQHKNAWPSLIGFGGCHLSSASHVEE